METLLEVKSRELFELNEALREQARHLEEEVSRRTADLEASKTLAEDASAAKSAFLAMISHEIRTPLNGLLGMGSALAESGLTDEQADMAALMQSSGETLLSLLNDILDLTKIEARQMEVETIPFDLPELIDRAQQLFSFKAREKGLLMAVTIEPSAERQIRGDPTRLGQVISNLLSNAIKFTKSGSVTLRVWVDAEGGHCLVTDTGRGVPNEQRETLFKPFSQAGRSVTRRFGGTGLGLAIAREMCRLMGGDLTFAPNEGGGSSFHASFDVGAAVDAAQPVATPATQGGDWELLLGCHLWRILAAEDNLTNQRVLDLMLKRYGLDLTMVEDGAAAVSAHCANPFDLILMDVNMPKMNGLEAAGFIRQFEQARDLPRVPIIALTANAMTHQVEEYLRQGIDAHVAKPVRRATLGAAMARLLCQSHPEVMGHAPDGSERGG